MKGIIRTSVALLAVMLFVGSCDVKKEPYIQGEDDAKQILQFIVDGVEGTIDEASKTVTLDFAAGTDVSHLVPVIKVSRYATVMPESGVAQDFTQPVLYTVTSFNGDSVQYMVSAVVHDAENEKSILSFRVEDPVCEGVINEVAKTVTLTFPEGTEVSQLVPIIEVSEGATVVPASGEAQDFTHAVEYTVTAMNGTTAVYTVTAVVEENPVGPTGKTVLLNDYTGVRCNNCPAAAELAHSLQEQYGERLIVMSIHAGSLSVPAGSLPDFRTEEGTEWYNNNTSNPIGSVDRVKLLSGYTLPVTQWENAVDAAFGETQTVELKVNNSYNETSRMLTTTIDAQALETLSGELALTVCFVEDSIVGMQVTPSGMQNDYLHRHVFRGTLNGAYGDPVEFDGDNSFEKSFSTHVDEAYDDSHGYIVAYIYDNSQNMKILQTAIKKIK